VQLVQTGAHEPAQLTNELKEIAVARTTVPAIRKETICLLC